MSDNTHPVLSVLGVYDIPIIELPKFRRSVDGKRQQLELCEHFVRYGIWYEAEGSVDDGVMWEEERVNWRMTFKRDRIAGICHLLDQKTGCWAVEIEVDEMRDKISIYYPGNKAGALEALALYKNLEKYHLGVD